MVIKNYFKAVIALSSLVLFSSNAFAFKPFKSKSLSERREPIFRLADTAADTPTSAPFDGGISLLIAAGLGYAGKKGLDKRKRLKEEQDLQK
jgi:hypothetical protein